MRLQVLEMLASLVRTIVVVVEEGTAVSTHTLVRGKFKVMPYRILRRIFDLNALPFCSVLHYDAVCCAFCAMHWRVL